MSALHLQPHTAVNSSDHVTPSSSSFDSRGLIKGMVTSKTMRVCHCEKELGETFLQQLHAYQAIE